MLILWNEILLSDDEEIIYKTFDKEDLFGMYSSKRGEIIEPSFLHIFEFDDDGTTVVISPCEHYFEMDWNGIVMPLSEEKEK